MKNIIAFFVLIACFVGSCNPERVQYTMYSSNTEEHKKIILYSFELFNNIVGCEAAELILKQNDNFLFGENNLISEIAFVKNWNFCNPANNFFTIAGCITGIDKDIIMMTENFFDKSGKCELVYNQNLNNIFYDCDYRISGILHELGHSFGLSHVINKKDIMNEMTPSYISVDLFRDFKNELIKNTNICKTFFKKN